MNSRDKGKRGELELAAFLRERGWQAKRGQQHKGGEESPDVVHDIPNIHIECKRVEAGNLYLWLEQAIRDCGQKVPVVAHRKNNREWVAVLRLDDLLNMLLLNAP